MSTVHTSGYGTNEAAFTSGISAAGEGELSIDLIPKAGLKKNYVWSYAASVMLATMPALALMPLDNPASAQTIVAAHVSNNTALVAMSTATAAVVSRDGYAALGDSPPLLYAASSVACSLNSGAGDGGSQVPSSDGKCWVANFPASGIDVREFGAMCNGSTDDSTPIQRAINYLGTSGKSGRVLIPATANGCVGSVTMSSANNVALVGTGPVVDAGGGAKLTAPNLTSSVITVTNLGGVDIENLLLKGASSTATNLISSVPPVLVIQGTGATVTNEVTLKNVSVYDGYDLVKFYDAGVIRWYGGQLRNFTHTAVTLTGNAAVNGGGGDEYFYGLISDQDNASYQNQGTLTATVYATQNGGSLTLDGIDFLHGHVGYLAAPGNGQYVIWTYITNAYFDTCDYYGTTASNAASITNAGPGNNMNASYVTAGSGVVPTSGAGIALAPTGTGVVYGIMGSNIWTSTCTNGILLSGTSANEIDGVNLTNWQALNNGKSALYSTNASHLNISNPMVVGSGEIAKQTTYPGMEFDTGTNWVTITGGHSGSGEGYTSTQKFGLAFDAGFTGTASVGNINLAGNYANPFYTGGGSTNITVSNSPPFNPQGVTSGILSGASYTAGPTPETLYLSGGASVLVKYGNMTVCSATPCTVNLNPGQTIGYSYAMAPTVIYNKQ